VSRHFATLFSRTFERVSACLGPDRKMSSRLLSFHYWHISDSVTMTAYREAIRRAVRPGDVVLDLGAGTGILSLMACEAGAARVYAVEPEDIIAVIPKIAADNGVADRVICKKAVSFDVELPEKADVMIASMLDGAGVFGTNMLKIVLDARKRLVKPGGVIIPEAVTACFCPVELPNWYESAIDCWSKPRVGWRCHAVRPIAVNQTGKSNVCRNDLLARPQQLGPIELATTTSTSMEATLRFEIEREGTFHALASWIDVTMAANVQCSSSPLDERPMSWSHLILGVESPAAVRSGDRVEAAVRAGDFGDRTIVVWDIWLRDALGQCRAEFHHSTFYGLPLTKGEHRGFASGAVPALSVRGQAELTVLTLCDGFRSLEEIIVGTLKAHGDLFANPRDAGNFVLRTLARTTSAA
jgi:protein arginine N-methyltransferase 1